AALHCSPTRRSSDLICTITSDLIEYDGDLVHVLDIEPSSPGYRGVCAPPRALELVYDGRRRVSSSDCVWQPRDVELPAFLRPQASSRRPVPPWRARWISAKSASETSKASCFTRGSMTTATAR